MWSLFNAPVQKSTNHRYAIVDNTGLFYVDAAYKEEGRIGNWLIYEGYTQDEHNNIVYLYRFIE